MGTALFELQHLSAHFFQLFPQRRHQLAHGRGAGLQVGLGAVLVLLQRRLGEVEEGLVIGLERVQGERFELLDQLRLRLVTVQ